MSTTNSRYLTEELTTQRAEEFMQSLLLALAYTNVLEAHLAAMSEADSAGVQVMLAAKRAAIATAQILRILENSPAVLDVLALFDRPAPLGAAPASPPIAQ